MSDAVAPGVVVDARTGERTTAEAGTRVPRRGLNRNLLVGDIPVSVEAIARDAADAPWTVTVSMQGMMWDESVPANFSRDEAVEQAWRVVCLRAAALRPAGG